ncbi:hypothetical protein C2S51_036822 [Perilla frutescens var. frutescens]|nr:hypothetical protein C2S51_036822 [Perilla frutescens var. frutescens]
MLPRFIVIKSYYDTDKGYVYYKVDEGEGVGTGSAVLGEDETVFSTLVKIEVEPASSGDDSKFVNLRFCHSNKYWAKKVNDKWIVAQSKQPEEDTSKSSSTLFELHWNADSDKAGVFYFTHVQSGGRVRIDDSTKAVYVDSKSVPGDGYLTYVDWDTLVNMPQHVAFKGDNGKFLRAYWFHDLPYLQFSSSDPNDEVSGHEVQLMPDGHVMIKCVHYSKFWRYGYDWIWADGSSSSNINTILYWPVKIDDTTIALRSAANNHFCKRLTADNKTNCLNASASTITNEARLQVQELVVERKIYNVRYRMEDARIFGEKPFVAGSTTAINRADEEDSIAVSVEYKDSSSYSFTRSLSIMAGVKTTIEADILGIVDGEIEFSFEITGAFEWNNTTTTEKTVTATGTVPVPARSKAIVNYVGTMGTCNVPYSYTQQDKSSTDGRVVENQLIDGIYTGVNCYNFSFEVLEYQPLTAHD